MMWVRYATFPFGQENHRKITSRLKVVFIGLAKLFHLILPLTLFGMSF